MDIDWTTELADQLDWHWREHARPRLHGLTDDEYFWEPVKGCWNVRPRPDDGGGPGTGAFTVDFARPEPSPPPVTTIAWRLGHINVGVLGMRVAGHFGGPACSYETFPYAGSADEALAQLDSSYDQWIKGVRGLSAEDLARPCGQAEPFYPDAPLAALVLHINREMLHHGAEIALLRDLYRWKES
jgi:DinB superfamily